MFNLRQIINEEIEGTTELKPNSALNESKVDELINFLNTDENKPFIYPKPSGVVRSFCASSFQNDQETNFDKISLAINLKVFSKDIKININTDIPIINFFGIFDGHNGSYTSEKLRDKLIKYLIFDEEFLIRTDQSIINAYKKIDEEIKSEIIKNDIESSIIRSNNNNANNLVTESANLNSIDNNLENSGSSALICLTVNNNFYIANLGTSRGILSSNIGGKISHLTKEHGLKNEIEKERIMRVGGIIYEKNNCLRIKQGDLKSGRSIGDIHAKLLQKEGRPAIYLNIPDILQFKLTNDEDFIILMSDSVYEKLDTSQIIRIVYENLLEAIENNFSIDLLYSLSIQQIYKSAIKSGASGALTCVILFFSNFIELFINKNTDYIKEKLYHSKKPKQIEFLNENIIRLQIYEANNSRNVNDSHQNSINQNNLIINNFSNRISITKETKIYCCCFKKKKKIKNIQNNNQSNNNQISIGSSS